MSKRRRIQLALEFSSGLVALLLANLTGYIVFTTVVKKIVSYPTSEWYGYTLTLIITYIIVFVCFSSPLNMLKRSRPMEFLSNARNCAFTYALLAVFMFLTKNRIIESRYLFISSFIAYFCYNLAFRFIIKKLMLARISESKYATQTGITTTTDRAK